MEGQTTRLYNLLSDNEWHSTIEIMEKIYGNDHLGLARCGARIYDIKKRYGVQIEGKKDEKNKTIYWYRIKPVLNLNEVMKEIWKEDMELQTKLFIKYCEPSEPPILLGQYDGALEVIPDYVKR